MTKADLVEPGGAGRLVTIAAGSAVALCLYGFAEALMVVFGRPAPAPELAPQVVVLTLGTTVPVLWLPLVYALAADALQAVYARVRTTRAYLITVAAALGALGVSAYWYAVLGSYAPFRSYPPVIVGLVASFLYLTGHWWANAAARRPRWRIAVNASALLAAALVYAGNYLLLRGLYPSLHHAAAIITFVLLARGLGGALRGWRGRVVPPLVAVAAGCLALATVGRAVGVGEAALPYVHHSSELGRIDSMRQPLRLAGSHTGDPQAIVRPDDDAVERFRALDALPDLPDGFRLSDYNILLIASEATRYDKTSLSPGGPATTPRLRQAARHAWVAHRAYAPSSGTLHSMSSVLTMKYPSAVEVTTWMQPWYGELAASEDTVAELLGEVGYETWWIGHNHNLGFSRSILGLDQGFQRVDLVDEYSAPPSTETDEQIADLAVERLRRLATSPERRFFGLVFFASPHGPYVSHGHAELPSASEADRYLQEIRNVDVQFGRVFRTLEETGLLDRTIVVFFSDHGEEFREHGGIRHKATVYTESIRVPLVMWIPGAEPEEEHQPVSTIYPFLWLFLHAEAGRLRSAAEEILEELIGPILRETGGAVVAELLGHDRIKTTLVYDDHKVNYDYRSRVFEVYEIDADPLEQVDRFDRRVHNELVDRFRRYDLIRSETSRHRFLPTKQAPSIREFQRRTRRTPRPLR